ncbi:MAG: hypothetical protein HQK95_01385 [Nitrospirae bacterium]|nr:hypothetical protein [Nitrospirota bacterium]
MADGGKVIKEKWYNKPYIFIRDKVIKDDMLATLRSKAISTAKLLSVSFIIILLKDKMSLSKAWDEVWSYGGILLVNSIILSEIFNFLTDAKKIIGNMEARFDKHVETIDNKVKKQLNDTLDKAKIVIHMGIEPLNTLNIKTVRGILDLIPDSVTQIYAIDNTHPNHWWTNSMLGYLACQAKWAAKKSANKIHRYFVLSKGEMRSVAGKKIVQIHHLMGFETYLILEDYYNEQVDKFYKMMADKRFIDTNEEIYNRELLVWNNSTTYSSTYDDELIYGYHSWWDVRTTQEDRMSMTTAKNIHGKDIQLNKLMIELLKKHKFDDNNNRSEEIVERYLTFINKLKVNIKPCVTAEAVEETVSRKSDIVHIPAAQTLEIDTISEIIDKYIEKCDNLAEEGA